MRRYCWVLLASLALTAATTGCEASDPDAVHLGQISTPAELTELASEVLNEPDRLRRMQRLSALLEVLPDDRFPEIAQILASRAIPPRQEDLGLVVHAWARVDPKAALDQAVGWKRSGVSWTEPTLNHAINEVVYVWAQQTDAEAERAVSRLPAALQTGAMIALVRGFTESDHTTRATQVVTNAAPALVEPLASVLAAQLATQQGVEAAIGWAETVPADKRVGAYRRTAEVIARIDPERAAAWTHANSGQPHATGMARRMAQEWARHAPFEEVVAWIDTLPSEAERKEAASWAFQDWHRRDRDAAMSWLQGRNPLEALYRPIISAHAKLLLRRGPGEAIRFAEGFVDPDRRRDAELALAHQWLAADAEAANEWIREAGLEEAVAESAARRAEVIEQRKRRQRENAPKRARRAAPAR